MSSTEKAQEQVIPERDPGRWMALGAVLVAALAVVFDGAMMGLIAPAVAHDLSEISGRKRLLTYGAVTAVGTILA